MGSLDGLKKWQAENPERVKAASREYRAKHPEMYRVSRAKDPIGYLVRRLRNRAKDLGVPFNLRKSDICMPTHCPVLGIELAPFQTASFSSSNPKPPNYPEVDRFIPHLGYVRGNINIISARANAIKQNASLEELASLLIWMRRTTGDVISVGLDELQRKCQEWIAKQPFGPGQQSWEPLMGIGEEFGELCHAHLKMNQHIRMGENHCGKARDAIADILIFMAGYCNSMGFKMSECLAEALPEVMARDWAKYPKNGRTE